jgi:hypothetical protein
MPIWLQAAFQRTEKWVRIAASDLWGYARDHIKTSLLTFTGAAVAIPLVSWVVPSFHLDWSHEL